MNREDENKMAVKTSQEFNNPVCWKQIGIVDIDSLCINVKTSLSPVGYLSEGRTAYATETSEPGPLTLSSTRTLIPPLV